MKTEQEMRGYIERLGGHKAIADAFDPPITEARVSQCIGRGYFPTGWWRVLSRLAIKRGAELPMDAFKFKEPSADAA